MWEPNQNQNQNQTNSKSGWMECHTTKSTHSHSSLFTLLRSPSNVHLPIGPLTPFLFQELPFQRSQLEVNDIERYIMDGVRSVFSSCMLGACAGSSLREACAPASQWNGSEVRNALRSPGHLNMEGIQELFNLCRSPS